MSGDREGRQSVLELQSSGARKQNGKGGESCDAKLVVEEEIEKRQESAENKKVAVRRLDVEQRSAALVCKAAEVIIDCDSD